MARYSPTRRYQDRHAAIRILADAAIPKIARGFRAAIRGAAKSMDTKRARELMFTGRLDELWATINWTHMRETMKTPLTDLGELWLDAGSLGAGQITRAFHNRGRKVRFKKEARIEDAFGFDRFDAHTQAFIRAYQDELIADLGLESRSVIESVILAALREGKAPEETVSMIRSVIGLLPRQAQAVLNFRDELIAGDSNALQRALVSADNLAAIAAGGLDDIAIDAIVADYADSYVTYRAKTISQTETTRASALGLQDSYRQSVDRGALPEDAITQKWNIALDEKTCPICIAISDMNPLGVGLNEQFDSPEGPIDSPPAHVNCRCSIEIVTNLDLVPDESLEDAS